MIIVNLVSISLLTYPIDDWIHPPRLDTGYDSRAHLLPILRGRTAQGHALQSCFGHHHLSEQKFISQEITRILILPWIDVDGAPAPDHHHPSVVFGHLKVSGEVYVGEMLDDDVEACAEMLHHLLVIVLVVVVEHVMSTRL